MARVEPTVQEIEAALVEPLREQEIGALAVLRPDGGPSVSTMHFAADGLAVCLHTFTYNRKHEAIQRDARVSYTPSHLPPGGFYDRMKLRSVQIDGTARLVTDEADIERAVEVSREPFDWLQDSGMLDTFKNAAAYHQAFFRIDPVEALWNDNRVGLLWRTILTFTPDGQHVASGSPYNSPRSGASVGGRPNS